ncbi:alpha/beta fold hydrolase [Jatrophihabitans fulvus]
MQQFAVTVRNGDVELVGDGYRPAGGTEPSGTILLFHGGGQTRHSWKGTGRILAGAGWQTISFDLRGHGDSSWSARADYSMDAHIGDLAACCTRFPDPVLVGASLGGLVSLLAVGEEHVTARALVLVDVAPRIEVAGTRRIGEFMRKHADSGFADLDEVADAVAAYNPHRPRPTNLDGLRKNVRLRADGRWYWHWDPAMLLREPRDAETRQVAASRFSAAAERLTLPTLLVRGARSDVLSAEGAGHFLELVPHATFVDVGGAGHMVAGDDNDIFADAVGGFLAQL